MTIITQADFETSIMQAFQQISYTHSEDFINAMIKAWQRETHDAAKNAIEQIILNSQMSLANQRPICQDTGIAVVFLKIGMQVQWDTPIALHEMVNNGVRQAYCFSKNTLRASVIAEPAGRRQNTKDNTPAVIHIDMISGDKVEVICAAKGGGSENKAKFAMLNPADSVVEWVLKMIPTMGAGWCPPGVIGLGIGGTPEKAMLMAKESLMQDIDIDAVEQKQLMAPDSLTDVEQLRLELFNKINALGIGAQGLGGNNTVLDVKIVEYPTHAASLPVALIPNCAATRHIHFTLTGHGPAQLTQPRNIKWPNFIKPQGKLKTLALDTLTHAEIEPLKQGETVLLTGYLLTARDAAHKKLIDLLNADQPLPVNLKNKLIYYVGPVDPVADEVVGPAGPTTSTRMDKFTPQLLQQTGLLGMIGKAERSLACVEAIKAQGAIYFMAVGGAAYLVSKSIKSARVLAFPELGMEAIYEFYVENMPVIVATDPQGNSVYDDTIYRFLQRPIRVKPV